MELVYTLFICVVAGLGAGLGTGFAGMSAAVVISPMLITFLGVNPYQAIGTALASDVLASAISAFTYSRNKNIDIKNSRLLFVSVLMFTLIGALVAHLVPPVTMGNLTVFSALLMGLKFLFTKEKEPTPPRSFQGNLKIAMPILCGALIGFICGFIGAGGGIMMLIILTVIMGDELKIAVGTSVFIMTFTALFGASSHFYLVGSFPEPMIFITCVISTLIFALLGARFANKASTKVLNRVTGAVLTTLGLFMVATTYLL